LRIVGIDLAYHAPARIRHELRHAAFLINVRSPPSCRIKGRLTGFNFVFELECYEFGNPRSASPSQVSCPDSFF
jgi:hypothetical protein